MSWLAYEILTTQPDFTRQPRLGTASGGRELVNSPGAGSFAAWPGRTDKILGFDFTFFSGEEWRNLREFIDRHGGRAKAFYLPSWQHDFELQEDATVGDASVLVTGSWHTDNVTEERPDTLGRVLFFVNHLGQTATHWVQGFADEAGNDRLVLDRPLTLAMEAGRTVVAFCYLARLVDDTLETRHQSPSHGETELGFRSIIQTRRVEQQELAEGEALASMTAPADIVATDADPIFTDPRTTEAVGPVSYGGTQPFNYDSTWGARVVDNTVVLTPPFGAQFATDVYDGSTPPKQIALTFDAASREILAWERDDRQTRIGYRDGLGDIQHLTFPGFSPCAFNTFAIDSTVTAGEATIAIFYLKSDDASIYCRLADDEFATERRYLISPLAPLRLHRAVRETALLSLVGMDVGHRLTRWRSANYLTPPPQQAAVVLLSDIEGLYRNVAVPTAALEGTALEFSDVAGSYRNTLVPADPPETGAAEFNLADITGSFLELRRATTAVTGGDFLLADSLPGEYKLVRKQTTAEDGAAEFTLSDINGSYAAI